MKKNTIAALVTAGTLAAGGLSYKLAFAPAPADIGPVLAANRYTMAVTIPHEDANARRLTPWTIAAPLAEPFSASYAASFEARYGVALDNIKGYTVSHRWADDLVDGVLNDASNPLGLACNPRCYLTYQDRLDIELAARPGNRESAYDTLFVPLDLRLHPPPTPTQPPPVATPPPTPLPPAGYLAQREIPCPAGLVRSTAQLCLEVWEVTP